MSWFVVGGVAIGATAGAIVGSKKGGDDVWKDALIGGAIGGAGGAGAGLGSGAGVFGGIGAEAAAPLAVEGALPAAGIMGAEATAVPGIGAASSAPIAGTSATMLPGATTPIAAAAPQTAAGSTGIMGVGANAAAPIAGTSSATMPGTVSSAFAPGMQAPVQMVQAPAATEYAMFGGDTAPTATKEYAMFGGDTAPTATKEYAMFGGDTAPTASNVATQTPPPAADSPLKKGFESAKSWLSEPKNAMLTGVLGLGALSMFNQNNEDNFGGSNVTQTGYPLSPNFKPTRTNPQQYRYASSYAGGGQIQSGMFPQSQMDRTQFATPSQMPVSREIIGSDYDSTISPYTGDLPRFAKGGDTSDKAFADARRYQGMIDPRMNVQTPDTPDWVRSRGVYHDEDVDTKYQDALTAAQTRMAKAASRANVQLGAMQKPTPLGKLNLGPVVKEKQQAADYDDGLAGGGITSLGSYAHGGNPRLLRGPGDGMSDDIPASIADKQPARLADGEFVVPADVVSGLGNGSTEAGAKKLHKMMDNVRVARTGTKKQGKEIKAEKHMPGMASGGIASFADGGAADLSQYYVYDASGNQVPLSQLQDTFAPQTATPSAPTQPIAPTVNPSQYAMGGQYTPDYRMPGSTLSGGLGRWSNIAGEAERAARPASKNQQITQSYLQNLGRAPDQMGFNYWMQQPGPVSDITNAIATSQEAQDLTAPRSASGSLTNEQAYLNQLYQQYLNRTPDQEGSQFWQNQLGGALNQDQVKQAIMNSPEAQRYERDYLTNAYQQYLGRTPDQEGLQFWQNQMQGTTNQQDILKAIQGSQEAQAYAAQHAQQAQPQAQPPQQAAPAQEEKKARKGGILAVRK